MRADGNVSLYSYIQDTVTIVGEAHNFIFGTQNGELPRLLHDCVLPNNLAEDHIVVTSVSVVDRFCNNLYQYEFRY